MVVQEAVRSWQEKERQGNGVGQAEEEMTESGGGQGLAALPGNASADETERGTTGGGQGARRA